jgi:hypothetical protein
LHDQIHARQPGRRPATAEGADVADHEAGEARREARPVKAELGGQPRAKVRQHHVGVGEEALDDARGRGVAQVQRQRVLAAVARQEVTGLAGRQRRQLPHGIALDRLDLDDVRAALGEELRAERNGDELAELDDLDAGEWSRVVHGVVVRAAGRQGSPAGRGARPSGSVAVNLLCSKGPHA